MIGSVAQHGSKSASFSDDDPMPIMSAIVLPMHLSVTYHSPSCRKKRSLLSLFSVHDLLARDPEFRIDDKKQKDIIWYHVLDQTILTCGRCTSLFPL